MKLRVWSKELVGFKMVNGMPVECAPFYVISYQIVTEEHKVGNAFELRPTSRNSPGAVFARAAPFFIEVLEE